MNVLRLLRLNSTKRVKRGLKKFFQPSAIVALRSPLPNTAEAEKAFKFGEMLGERLVRDVTVRIALLILAVDCCRRGLPEVSFFQGDRVFYEVILASLLSLLLRLHSFDNCRLSSNYGPALGASLLPFA